MVGSSSSFWERELGQSIMILLVETKMRVPIELIKGLMIVSVDLVVVE